MCKDDLIRGSSLLSILQPPAPRPLPSPPLPLGTGHTALLLASGHLNGVVRDHVVRGVVSKSKRLVNTEYIEKDGGVTVTRSTHAEIVQLTVRAVGADGVIHTFSQRDEA